MTFIIVPINICQHIPIMKLGFQDIYTPPAQRMIFRDKALKQVLEKLYHNQISN